jgi:hypothetical protein
VSQRLEIDRGEVVVCGGVSPVIPQPLFEILDQWMTVGSSVRTISGRENRAHQALAIIGIDNPAALCRKKGSFVNRGRK